MNPLLREVNFDWLVWNILKEYFLIKRKAFFLPIFFSHLLLWKVSLLQNLYANWWFIKIVTLSWVDRCLLEKQFYIIHGLTFIIIGIWWKFVIVVDGGTLIIIFHRKSIKVFRGGNMPNPLPPHHHWENVGR